MRKNALRNPLKTSSPTVNKIKIVALVRKLLIAAALL